MEVTHRRLHNRDHYKILHKPSLKELEKAVNIVLEWGVGWEAIGGVSIIKDIGVSYMQAVTRLTKKKTREGGRIDKRSKGYKAALAIEDPVEKAKALAHLEKLST